MRTPTLGIRAAWGCAVLAMSATGWTQTPAPAVRATPRESVASKPATSPTPPALTDAPTTTTFSFPPPGEVRVMEERDLDRMLKSHGKRLLVVNFWATWCGPCVKEIPEFVQVAKQYRDKGVFFVGLSADFIDSWKTTVPPFLKAKQVDYPNFVLDVDQNLMIPKLSSDWNGTLPATFLFDIHGRKVSGFVGQMSKADLTKAIEAALARTSP